MTQQPRSTIRFERIMGPRHACTILDGDRQIGTVVRRPNGRWVATAAGITTGPETTRREAAAALLGRLAETEG